MTSVEFVLWLWLIGTFLTVLVFTIRCDKLEKRIEKLEREKEGATK